jgi:hypothetical protein
LKQHRSAKTARRWLGAACALAICSCLLPGSAIAQTDSSTHTSSKEAATTKITGARTSSMKTSTAKKPVKSTASSKSGATPKSHPTTGPHARTTASNSKSKRAKSKKVVARGQQKIDPERAQKIQEALIREHYLSGEPAGTWNQASEDALRRYQADHGWQSKMVPDSRALISLGLGPNHDHLLNPESAMTTGPEISRAAPPVSSTTQAPVSHSAEPGSTMNSNSSTSDHSAADHAATDPSPADSTAPANHNDPNPQR